MKPIRLPDPPGSPRGMPEIFQGGVHGVIRRTVVIGDGSLGSEQQSTGLVRALGLSEKQLLYRVTRPSGGINEWLHWLPVSLHMAFDYAIWQILSYSETLLTVRRKKTTRLLAENGGTVGLKSVLGADAKQIVTMAHETFDKEGPLLVVASGRDTISISSTIKRLASEHVFVVQIQHPRSHLNRFDLVITPRHNCYPLTSQAQEQVPRLLRWWITLREPPEKNVVLTVGALHQIDSASLRAAAIAWHHEFALLPKPLLVVNVGGPTRYCSYGIDLPKQLADSLHNILTSCGSVCISFSRRTPKKISNVIVKELGDHPKVQICDGKEANRHMGRLAWADAFVVTADSVTMLSEACSTGKPVYVIGAERCKWELVEFHKSVRERCMVRPLMGLEDMSKTWSYPPLNDTAEAASRVREAIAGRGWVLRS